MKGNATMHSTIVKRILLFLSVLMIVTLACDLSVNIAPTSEAPTAAATPIPVNDPPTPTPEIFIALTQAIPAQVQLNEITLAVQEASLDACDLPNCPPTPAGTRYLCVPLQALNLPADQFLDYKNLPEGIAIHDNTGANTPFNRLTKYAPDTQRLFLYFAVPQTATVFGLQWPGIAEIPLKIVVNTASATIPASVAGWEVSVDSLNIILPSGLASGVRGSQVPRADGQELPYWQKTPGHAEFKLEGYPLQGRFHQPQIYVYPAMLYVELVPATFESMHRLRNVMNPGAPITADQLPAVPFFNAAQLFASNIQAIPFQNGSGMRFLSEYGQYPAPVNNHELFYQFQGFTNDGEYYIVATLPITAPALAETGDAGANLPAGGIQYPFFADPDAETLQTYYEDVANLLSATPNEAFTPTIGQLDALIQSMQVIP